MQRSRTGVILMVVLLAGCGQATGTTTSTAPTSASVAPSPSAVATTVEPTQSAPTAADDVAAFVAAARATDTALRDAEQAIGTLTAQPHFVVDQPVADLARAAGPALDSTWLALPPGAPDPLLEAAVRVAGGLEVRLDAIEGFSSTWSSDDLAPDGELSRALDCLDNGRVPAAGFADDVQALLTQASATAPVPSVAPDSAEALRISVIATWLHLENTASLACGGAGSYGSMPVVTWTVAPGAGEPITGMVDDTYFEAKVPHDPELHSIGTDLQISIAAG